MEAVADYSFTITMVVMTSFFVMIGQFRQIAQDYAMARNFSLVSIGMNLVWNFFYFTLHFQLSVQESYFQYLGLPAFWYFISSFNFETRLFM